MGCDAAAGGPARVRGVHHAHDRPRLHRGQARHQVSSVQCPLLIPIPTQIYPSFHYSTSDLPERGVRVFSLWRENHDIN